MSKSCWEHVYSGDGVELNIGMKVWCLYQDEMMQFEVWDVFGDVICLINDAILGDTHIEKLNTEIFAIETYWWIGSI